MGLAVGNFSDIIEFARPSGGSYFDAAGVMRWAAANEPRINHDPVTRAPLGLLVEEPRTNLVFPSVPSALWGLTPAATLAFGAGVVPDGTNAAVLFGNGNAGASTQYMYRGTNTSSYVAGTRYVAGYAVKAKAGVACPKVRVLLHGNAFGSDKNVYFDPSNPSAGAQSSGSPEAYGVVPLGDGWYYVWVSHTATATITTWSPILWWASRNAEIDAGILVWYCQLEIGAFPTSYIPTTTAAVTRAADQPRVTGANFANWYNPAEGTLVVEYAYNTAANNSCAISLDNGTSAEAAVLASTLTTDRFILTSAGTPQYNAGFVAYTPQVFGKRALAYRTGEIATLKDGGTIATATGILIPAPTQLCIGYAGYFSSSRLNGHIKAVTYIARRLSDAELVEITS